ncbi:hypothetical protein GLOIN_2v1471349 [Rhizophagus clarus]|uniref:YABBY protein C-terminal domain-containing protein n=2 Tax=Rhizophagus clarus TaxID=94130 RepID=A0A8H3LBN6_9GLOM|nr:hypothetical protein GLOIN_2v1471349 [Rhizophagus clarus]
MIRNDWMYLEVGAHLQGFSQKFVRILKKKKPMGKSSKRTRRKTKRRLNPYNLYMREEIIAIKENNPTMTHREAFTQAARSWRTSTKNPKNQQNNNQGRNARNNKSKRREIIQEKKPKKQTTRKEVIDKKKGEKIQKMLNNDKSKKREIILKDILQMIDEECSETEAEAEGKKGNANDIDDLDVEIRETNENEEGNVEIKETNENGNEDNENENEDNVETNDDDKNVNLRTTVNTDVDVNMADINDDVDNLDVETEINAKNGEMVNVNNADDVIMNQYDDNNDNNDNGDETEISKVNQMIDDQKVVNDDVDNGETKLNEDPMIDENEVTENDETIGSGMSEENQAAENETIGSGVSEKNQAAENETINSVLSEENQVIENDKPGTSDVIQIDENITDIETLKHSSVNKIFLRDEQILFYCDGCKLPYLVRNDHSQ